MAEFTAPYGGLNISFRDNSDEYSSVHFNVPSLTAANFDANVAAIQTGIASLVAAVRNVTLCNPEYSGLSLPIVEYNMGRPASPWAQRELGLQIGYEDTVNGAKGRVTIPGVDWEALHGIGDEVDYANLQWIALKAKIEAVALSSYGNPVTVTYGRLVGRRS